MPILLNDEDAEKIVRLLEGKGNVTLSAKLRKKMAVGENDDAFRNAAADAHHNEGVLEVDEDAIVSVETDGNGAYVQAWIWVDNEEAKVKP